MNLNLVGGLVAMNFIFPSIDIYWVDVIVPIDVFFFSEGWPNHQPVMDMNSLYFNQMQLRSINYYNI